VAVDVAGIIFNDSAQFQIAFCFDAKGADR
jgi:hypothetical protein